MKMRELAEIYAEEEDYLREVLKKYTEFLGVLGALNPDLIEDFIKEEVKP